MILSSVFNWNLDLDLPRYGLIYRSEYIFNFILMNICLVSGYLNRYKQMKQLAPWILTLFFCLYAFWDEDYFSFAEGFYHGLKDFRDLLYPPLLAISFGSYILFRFYIWGIALLLYYKTTKRFKLKANIAIYVFIFFFLLTFSYARVSLGMACYFYGLSFLLIPQNDSLTKRVFCTLCLFIIAFMAHRSMFFLIFLTPICYLRVSKWTVIGALILVPCIAYSLNYVISYVATGGIMAESAVSEAANHYTQYVSPQTMNWKYKLVTDVHYWGFYIGVLSIIYKLFFKHHQSSVPLYIVRLIPLIIIIQIIAICLINSNSFGLWIIGYRFLYMTGIPLCLIIAFLDQNHIFNKKWLRIIFFCPILYSEAFILGKILSQS